MTRRSLLLALPALVGAASAWRALAAPPRLPVPDDMPICRGGLVEGARSGDPDFDYLERLGLLEGHLIIGRRLLEAGQSRLAVPHFGHPIRELYTWLEPRIASRGAPQFERELEAMERFAEAGGTGTGGAFAPAWAALQPKLAAAKNAVPAARRDSPRFMLEHVAMMVYDVASDYGESIERGRIVNVVEYHDSMGFLLYAGETARGQAARGAAAAEWQEAAAVIEELREKVYPDLLPPSRPPQSISAVRARYDRIRAIAARATA